jgi:hypothetical protein
MNHSGPCSELFLWPAGKSSQAARVSSEGSSSARVVSWWLLSDANSGHFIGYTLKIHWRFFWVWSINSSFHG